MQAPHPQPLAPKKGEGSKIKKIWAEPGNVYQWLVLNAGFSRNLLHMFVLNADFSRNLLHLFANPTRLFCWLEQRRSIVQLSLTEVALGLATNAAPRMFALLREPLHAPPRAEAVQVHLQCVSLP